MILGFTGSRVGMTPYQRNRLRLMLVSATEAHHGDCVGSDAEFHQLCIDAGVAIVVHPPVNEKHRAHCWGGEHRPPREYLVRNRDIVNECDVLAAAPKEDAEPPPARGQGTWSTIRYARTVGRQIAVILPHASWDEPAP